MRLAEAIAREPAKSVATGVSGTMERLSKMPPGRAAAALGVSLLLYAEVGGMSPHEILDAASRALRDSKGTFELANRIEAAMALLANELRT